MDVDREARRQAATRLAPRLPGVVGDEERRARVDDGDERRARRGGRNDARQRRRHVLSASTSPSHGSTSSVVEVDSERPLGRCDERLHQRVVAGSATRPARRGRTRRRRRVAMRRRCPAGSRARRCPSTTPGRSGGATGRRAKPAAHAPICARRGPRARRRCRPRCSGAGRPASRRAARRTAARTHEPSRKRNGS